MKKFRRSVEVLASGYAWLEAHAYCPSRATTLAARDYAVSGEDNWLHYRVEELQAMRYSQMKAWRLANAPCIVVDVRHNLLLDDLVYKETRELEVTHVMGTPIPIAKWRKL
jgi:hypothetical protein